MNLSLETCVQPRSLLLHHLKEEFSLQYASKIKLNQEVVLADWLQGIHDFFVGRVYPSIIQAVICRKLCTDENCSQGLATHLFVQSITRDSRPGLASSCVIQKYCEKIGMDCMQEQQYAAHQSEA